MKPEQVAPNTAVRMQSPSRTALPLSVFLFFIACAPAAPQGKPVSRSQSVTSSGRPGMGATPYGNGVTFRVWAPGVDRVQVAGDFNGWQPSDLGNEFNGNWSVDWDGAQPGQQYKFNLHNAFTNSWFFRQDPRSQQMVNSAGNSIIHNRTSFGWSHDLDFHFPPTNQQVFYELHVGSFNSPGNGSPGNWNSAQNKLDYLQWLGVNVVEVMPVAEFPGSVSWGYNPAAPFAPATAYGSPDDMKSFVDQAHARGIAVVLDVVYNHWGPSDLPLWQFDGEVFADGKGGIYFYNDWRSNTPWGETRPDYGRPEVKSYIRDNVLQWLNEYHADGLRLDATYNMRLGPGGAEIPDGFGVMQMIADATHQSQPWKIVIAEDGQNNASVTNATGNGGAGADAQWESEFVGPVDAAVTAGNDGARDMGSVALAVSHAYNGDPFQRVLYTESHDVAGNNQRLPTQIGGWNSGGWNAQKQSTLGAAVALTSPGRPMLFQGQEFLTPGKFVAESPLDWSLSNTYRGILQMYQDLIHLRRNWNNTTAGLTGSNVNVFHVDNQGKVLAYHRWNQGGPRDDVVVVANFSGQFFPSYTVGVPRGGTWHVRLNSDWNGYSGNFGNTQTLDFDAQGGGMDGLSNQGTLALGPYSVVILSQDN